MTKEAAPEIKIPDPVVIDSDKPPEGYIAEDWNSLSPTEKEGILDSINNPETSEDEVEDKESIEEETLKEIAKEEPAKEKSEEKKVEKPATPPAEEKVVGTKAPVSTPAPVHTEEKTADSLERMTDDQLKSVRIVVVDSEVSVADTVPSEIQTKLDKLDEDFDNGDLSRKEYNSQRDALSREIYRAHDKELARAKADKAWDKEQSIFLRNRSEYLGDLQADGKFKDTIKSRALFGALGEQIKAMEADPVFASLSGIDLLIAADKEVKAALGITIETTGKAKPKDEGKPPAKLPDSKTLTEIPSAAPNTTEGAFSAIDKLHGQAYEDALDRLTQDQRDRYLDDLRPRAR